LYTATDGQQTGNNFVAGRATCCKQHVAGNKQHVEGNMLLGVNAALGYPFFDNSLNALLALLQKVGYYGHGTLVCKPNRSLYPQAHSTAYT